MTAAKSWTPMRSAAWALLAVVLFATLNLAAPRIAGAAPKKAKTIHRETVISRSKYWVKKRVPYSQRRYFRGYRQDCSGFVSMAWRLGRSHTTRTLPRVAKRVPVKHAQPGDAVLSRGHAVIFAGWKNKSKRTFYAYAEPSWGGHAHKKVKKFKHGYKVLRRPGIQG